jgi:hypothetical protein
VFVVVRASHGIMILQWGTIRSSSYKENINKKINP